MIYLAAVLVVVTLIAMASGKVPAVLVLGTSLALAGLLKIATPAQLFAGLSNGGVITVGGMLVIAKGLVQTGAVTRVTFVLLATVKTASQALRRLIVPVGVGSALINTTPIVAMLIPASKELEQSRGVPARELLLPITHVTTLAGSITLIGTSSNLLIAGIAAGAGVKMSMLSFAAVALPVALIGWVVIYLTAPLLLRGEKQDHVVVKDWRVEIPVFPTALAQGRSPEALGLVTNQEYALEEVLRAGERVDPAGLIEAGDLLIFAATETGVTALWRSPQFGIGPQHLYEISVGSGETGTLHDLEVDPGMQVIAARSDKALRDTPLVPGETCFVTGPSEQAWRRNPSVSLWQNRAGRAPQPRKTWIAVGILVAVIVAASFGLAPVELVAVSGALLMVITGVLTPTSAVRALDWNVLFILAGSIGLGAVVVESGLADALANGIRHLTSGSVLLVVIVFALVTAIMTNLVTNAAAASILTPVAISIATELSINPVTILALIGTCISFTFINPFSHQSNLMVMRPGGYSTATFARFGTPLIIVSVLAACAACYLIVRI